MAKFLYFSTKIYVAGAHWKRLIETLPMSTQNIFFRREIIEKS